MIRLTEHHIKMEYLAYFCAIAFPHLTCLAQSFTPVDVALACSGSTSEENRLLLKRVSGLAYDQYPVCVDSQHRWNDLAIKSVIPAKSHRSSDIEIRVTFSDVAVPTLQYVTSSFQSRQIVVIKNNEVIISSLIVGVAADSELKFVLPDDGKSSLIFNALTK